ncbi:MAG: DUF3313 family protein [Pseudomonadota bacterium]
MTRTNALKSVAAVAVLLLGLSSTPDAAAEEWRSIEHPTLDMLFTSVNANLTRYDTVYVETVSVWYPTETESALERANALRERAASELEQALVEDGVQLADTPSTTNAMIIRLQLLDFSDMRDSAQARAWQRRFKFNVAPGRVTMVAELIDAQTGNAIVRMADMQDEADSGFAADLQSALTHWSTIVATAVATPGGAMQLASR